VIPSVLVVKLVSTLTRRLVIYCHVAHVLLVLSVDQPVIIVLTATLVNTPLHRIAVVAVIVSPVQSVSLPMLSAVVSVNLVALATQPILHVLTVTRVPMLLTLL